MTRPNSYAVFCLKKKTKICPSFSLCACRILKITSCLRNALAPGRSKDRAILVNWVKFFSLSSAMVIVHMRGNFQRGVFSQRKMCFKVVHTADSYADLYTLSLHDALPIYLPTTRDSIMTS